MKFKAGDKVRFIGKYTNHGEHAKDELPLEELVKKYNNEFTVSHTIGDYIGIKEGIFWCFTKEELELIPKKFGKKDLKNEDMVTFRNGERRIVSIKEGNEDDPDFFLTSIDKYNDELKHEDKEEYDIIQVVRFEERAISCKSVFPVPIKERMTKKEAEEEFERMGKLIEII